MLGNAKYLRLALLFIIAVLSLQSKLLLSLITVTKNTHFVTCVVDVKMFLGG